MECKPRSSGSRDCNCLCSSWCCRLIRAFSPSCCTYRRDVAAAARWGAHNIRFFGSVARRVVARGNQQADSAIDFLVDFRARPLTTFLLHRAANPRAWPRIKLSLSGRISEPIGQVTDLKPLTYDEFLQVAKSTGYDAICLRPLQCSISTPLEEMIEMARKTREAGLKVSMVTCDADQPPNNDCSPFALLNVTPRLAMAEIFGTKLIRCQIKRPEHLGWAQRACDEAKERGLSTRPFVASSISVFECR